MYYRTLQVKRKATFIEIKEAYKRLALLTHPDKCNGAQERFLSIRKAYEVLGDAALRREYDATLRRLREMTLQRRNFVRPAPLQCVFRPVLFPLVDGHSYTFEAATHLLRCGVEHGDLITFNDKVGYFIGFAADDYLY
uniref:J domain-containing protein n=1 Tax=Lygus hesperus TaxID=30085 RepID=A0A0A9Y1S1_LYGHE